MCKLCNMTVAAVTPALLVVTGAVFSLLGNCCCDDCAFGCHWWCVFVARQLSLWRLVPRICREKLLPRLPRSLMRTTLALWTTYQRPWPSAQGHPTRAHRARSARPLRDTNRWLISNAAANVSFYCAILKAATDPENWIRDPAGSDPDLDTDRLIHRNIFSFIVKNIPNC